MRSKVSPPVAISTVSLWRRALSPSTTQLSLTPLSRSNSFESRCMRIMSALFTVPMVSSGPERCW